MTNLRTSRLICLGQARALTLGGDGVNIPEDFLQLIHLECIIDTEPDRNSPAKFPNPLNLSGSDYFVGDEDVL